MKNLVLLACLLSFVFTYGQKKNFVSNNSFYGTFETAGNKLKPGSITIEKFKTSVGEFSGSDLKGEGITFPYSCFDCSFTIESTGEPIRVSETLGSGFSEIVSAAKRRVQKEQEAIKLEELISTIASKNTLDQQRKVVYAAYPSFTDKAKIDKLAKRVELGEFLSYTTKEFVPLKKEAVAQVIEMKPDKKSTIRTVALVSAEKPEPSEQVKTENTETAPITEASQEPPKTPKIKISKCQKNIDRLKRKLEQAKKTQDHLITSELETALNRLLKKCK